MGILFDYKMKRSLQSAIQNEAIPGDRMLANILKATNQAPVTLPLKEVQSVASKRPQRGLTYAVIGSCAALAVLVLVFHLPGADKTAPLALTGNTPALESGTATITDEAIPTTGTPTDLLPPVISRFEVSSDQAFLTVYLQDDIGLDYSRIYVLSQAKKKVAFETNEDEQSITLPYEGTPVVVHVFDLAGNETSKKIAP